MEFVFCLFFQGNVLPNLQPLFVDYLLNLLSDPDDVGIRSSEMSANISLHGIRYQKAILLRMLENLACKEAK
jgi:hypothetical protein